MISVQIGRADEPPFATVLLPTDDGEPEYVGDDVELAQDMVGDIARCFPYREMSWPELLRQLPEALNNGYVWAACSED